MTTLLSYAFLSEPDPLQAGSTATLTLVVSNPSREAITCASITVTFRVGTNANDLTASAEGIVPRAQTGWDCAQTGGVFALTPQTAAAGVVAGEGLAFVFAGVALNAQPGTSTVTIGERASSPSQPQDDRTAPVEVAKFPAQFAVSDLTADATEVAPGGSVVLMWSGSPAEYRLRYDPSGDAPVDEPVSSAGPLRV